MYKKLDTYIIDYYNLSVRIIDLVSHTTYVVCVNFKRKLLNILIMENNFIQMAASAGHAVAYTIGPIFKHIIDFVQQYFTNCFTNIVL